MERIVNRHLSIFHVWVLTRLEHMPADPCRDACGLASKGALLFAIPGHENLAVEWLGEDAGAFLDQFLAALQVTMSETLGPRIADPPPLRAIGTLRLVARLLAKHIDEFTERDISLVLGR